MGKIHVKGKYCAGPKCDCGYKSEQQHRDSLYVDSPFDLATDEDNAYRDGVDAALEALRLEGVKFDALLSACRDVAKTLKSDSMMKVFNHYRPHMIKVLTQAIKGASCQP